MSDKYYLKADHQTEWDEVSREQFIAAEQAAGFRSKFGPSHPATSGFSGGGMRGKVLTVIEQATKEQPMSDMLLEPEDQIVKCECGRLGHSEQVRELPKGARVKAVTDIAQLGENVRTGTKGTVTGHCSDGRAIVFFEGFPHGHTFHTPNGYIEVIASEHQVTKSGTCVIPGCPCRGWSAQETAADDEQGRQEAIKLSQAVARAESAAKEVTGTFQQSRTAKYPAKVLAELTAAGELNNEQYQRLRRETVESEHQPAARGGGEEWQYIETTGSAEIRVGQITLRPHWTGLADGNEIRALFKQIITEHNQHQSLVAERERLLRSIRNVAIPALHYCEEKYGYDNQARLNLIALLGTIEQRSTSE